jgi:hypothetical protein
MTLDDESLLSAYLDGELDPARRLMVENALLDDAGLAERLQELVATRSMLGTLTRPRLERDLAPAVLACLPTRSARTLHVSWPSAASALAAAAAVVVAVTPLVRHTRHATRPHPETVAAGPSVPVRPVPPRPATGSATSPAPAPSVVSLDSPVLPAARDVDRQRILALIGHPDLPILNVGLGAVDEKSIAEVQAAIREVAPHVSLQGEIHLGAGRGADSARSGEEVVYVLVLDEDELESLSAQLCRRHPDRVYMGPPLTRDAGLMLANAGDVRFLEDLPAPAASRLESPPKHIAGNMVAIMGPTDAPADGHPRPDASPAPGAPAPPRTNPARPCLIWLRASGR